MCVECVSVGEAAPGDGGKSGPGDEFGGEVVGGGDAGDRGYGLFGDGGCGAGDDDDPVWGAVSGQGCDGGNSAGAAGVAEQ